MIILKNYIKNVKNSNIFYNVSLLLLIEESYFKSFKILPSSFFFKIPAGGDDGNLAATKKGKKFKKNRKTYC